MKQLELVPTDVHLRCINPANNKRRFYALSVQRTLFGEWALVREWGRIGLSGRLRSDFYPAAGPAIDALLGIAGQKVRRGYRPVGSVQGQSVCQRGRETTLK